MEREILQLLQGTPEVPYSHKEIGRTIDREWFYREPSWARPFLEKLLDTKEIRKDDEGRYYYDPASRQETLRAHRKNKG